jgi:hypothetical protein
VKQSVKIILCLAVLLTGFILPGCGGNKVSLPSNLDKLSLVDTWNQVAATAGIKDKSVELDSFRLMVDETGKVLGLDYHFHDSSSAKVKNYSVEVNADGSLQQHSFQGLSPSTTTPLYVFAELDAVKLAALRQANMGLELQADFQLGSVGYDCQNVNIFQLDNGDRIPLNKVTFNGDRFCVIYLYQLTPGSTGMETTALDKGKSTTQIWFFTDDINQAASVDYAAYQPTSP